MKASKKIAVLLLIVITLGTCFPSSAHADMGLIVGLVSSLIDLALNVVKLWAFYAPEPDPGMSWHTIILFTILLLLAVGLYFRKSQKIFRYLWPGNWH
ncbi:MAG: hypothetical protein IJT21_11365 [Synergistaceae bacterium]|nr:hypothetical protein [Synergistaceae bacterium]